MKALLVSKDVTIAPARVVEVAAQALHVTAEICWQVDIKTPTAFRYPLPASKGAHLSDAHARMRCHEADRSRVICGPRAARVDKLASRRRTHAGVEIQHAKHAVARNVAAALDLARLDPCNAQPR